MATKYDAIQNRINMKSSLNNQISNDRMSIVANMANAIKSGADIVKDIGSQIGTQQAQDWLKRRQEAYDQADSNGDFLKDSEGNTLTDFNDIQKRRDEWIEQYSVSNPAPNNMWARSAIEKAENANAEASNAKLAASSINQLKGQQNQLISDNEKSIIGSSIENPKSYNESVIANYGISYDDLEDYQKAYYDADDEMNSKRLALSVMYKANGMNRNNSDFRIAVYQDDIENSYWVDNWASAYQTYCLDTKMMTDEQFWEKWNTEANNETLKPSKGFFDDARKDNLRSSLSERISSLRNAKINETESLFYNQAVPAINSLYSASAQNNDSEFRYPNTDTINSIFESLGIDERFLKDDTKKAIQEIKDSGDAVSSCITAIHRLNEISSSDMTDDEKIKEATKYKSSLDPYTVERVNDMADLDPYYGKYSQMSDIDIYEHLNKIKSPLIEKANISDGVIVDDEAITAEYNDYMTSDDVIDSYTRAYIGLGVSDLSILEANYVSSLKHGYLETHFDEIEEYANNTGRTFDDILDELFTSYAEGIYKNAVDYFKQYGNVKNSATGNTPNGYLEDIQALYSNMKDKMVNTGADGRPYFPANGISTDGISNKSIKRYVEELNRGHINTANATQKKLLSLENQDQRNAYFNYSILPNSSLYTEKEVERWRKIANGNFGDLLKDNGIEISDYTAKIQDSKDKQENSPLMDMIEYEVGALVPAYYNNGVFDKTGFDNAAKKKATSIVGRYIDNVYFESAIPFDSNTSDKQRKKDLLEYIKVPVSYVTDETTDYTNRIVSNAASGETNDALSILLADSTISYKDGRAIWTKAIDATTRTRKKELSDDDRCGYALEGVLTDLGYEFAEGYSPTGDNTKFFNTAYMYLNELGTSSRNVVLASVNELYRISKETTALVDSGMSLGRKSNTDNSFISYDNKVTYNPRYDAKGTLSFDVYNVDGTKLGNNSQMNEKSLDQLAKQLTKEVKNSSPRQAYKFKGEAIGDSVELVGYEEEFKGYVDAYLSDNSGKAAQSFNSINEMYKATHEGEGLKAVVVPGAIGPEVKIIIDKEGK